MADNIATIIFCKLSKVAMSALVATKYGSSSKQVSLKRLWQQPRGDIVVMISCICYTHFAYTIQYTTNDSTNFTMYHIDNLWNLLQIFLSSWLKGKVPQATL